MDCAPLICQSIGGLTEWIIKRLLVFYEIMVLISPSSLALVGPSPQLDLLM